MLSLLGNTVFISVALAIFNLLPIPPLDGSKIFFSLISDELYLKLMRYERYGMILLVVVLVTGILNTPLINSTNFLMQQLTIFTRAGNSLVGIFM